MEYIKTYDHLTVPEATQIQRELREQLQIRSDGKEIRTIGGADISFNKYSTTVYAGIILLDFATLELRSYSLAIAEVKFPYVPGYLAFREVPALLKAWQTLPVKPDVLVVDGHGIAHPRRMGIAAHFGALTGQKTIGCAKKILFGKYEEPCLERGCRTIIYDKDEQIGYALRTKDKVKPVFISPGNKTGYEESLEIILHCIRKHRLPEPTRMAHNTVNLFRTGHLSEGFHQADNSQAELF